MAGVFPQRGRQPHGHNEGRLERATGGESADGVDEVSRRPDQRAG
jgi:hypothetical protein